MKNARLLFLICITLFSITCQSFRSAVLEPNVSLNSAAISQISLSGVSFIAKVDVENPNKFPIPLPKIDWELFVNSASFIQGFVSKDGSIRGMETLTLDIPFSFTYEGLFRSISSLIDTKEAAYNIALGVSFPIPIIENKVFHFDFSGILPIPQLPKLTSASARVSNFDYTGLSIISTVNVENPNVFPISFPEIDWDFGVSGVSVTHNREQSPGIIAAGAVAPVDLNLNIAFADIFTIIESVRNRSEVESMLSFATLAPASFLSEAKSSLNIPVTIPIIQKPEVSFQGITRKSLGRTMEFMLNWEINNRNSFDFDISEFDYEFLVNNRSWAKGLALNPPKIKAGARTLIPIDISISAPDIVVEIVDIINRGAMVDYSVKGNMSFLSGVPGLDISNFPLNFQGIGRIR